MKTLKELRDEKGMTQRDVARHLEMSITGYQNIEGGFSIPKPKRLAKLEELFPGITTILKKGKCTNENDNA